MRSDFSLNRNVTTCEHECTYYILILSGTVYTNVIVDKQEKICMVVTNSRVWINRVRLPILLMVS